MQSPIPQGINPEPIVSCLQVNEPSKQNPSHGYYKRSEVYGAIINIYTSKNTDNFMSYLCCCFQVNALLAQQVHLVDGRGKVNVVGFGAFLDTHLAITGENRRVTNGQVIVRVDGEMY